MARPDLSLCMIIRDEEAMLPDLLSSVAGLWDEFIAVDTGSSDNSPALLREAGAKVLPHQWHDDFAAARNVSLEAATGRWILFLDADERLTPPLVTQIRAVIQDPQAGAATVVLRNTKPDGSHRDAHLLRLFRNDPTIRFRHRIHEDVLADVSDFLAREKLALRHLDGVVLHLGYVREVAADRDKKSRDQGLLRQVLQDDPYDFYCWFKLLESARFWQDRPLWHAVAAEVEPLLRGHLTEQQRQNLQQNPWSGELAALIAEGLFDVPQEALAWLDETRARVNTAAAWHLRRALWLEECADSAAAAAAFAEGLTQLTPADDHLRPRLLLGQCRLAAADGRFKQAQALASQAVKGAPADAEALLAVVTFANLAGGQAQVEAFATVHRRQHPLAGGPLAEALLQAGQVGAACDLLTELVTSEPNLALGLLTCSLALGQTLTMDLELPAEVATLEFQRWIRILWQSRQTGLMMDFAENCGAVLAVFPWLEEFLAAETRRLGTGA